MSNEVQRRRDPRHDFPQVINYFVNRSDLTESLYGMSINISESGLCFYTCVRPEVGQDLMIKTSLKAPCVKGTVRWVKKYVEGLYRVGIMFSESERPI